MIWHGTPAASGNIARRPPDGLPMRPRQTIPGREPIHIMSLAEPTASGHNRSVGSANVKRALLGQYYIRTAIHTETCVLWFLWFNREVRVVIDTCSGRQAPHTQHMTVHIATCVAHFNKLRVVQPSAFSLIHFRAYMYYVHALFPHSLVAFGWLTRRET